MITLPTIPAADLGRVAVGTSFGDWCGTKPPRPLASAHAVTTVAARALLDTVSTLNPIRPAVVGIDTEPVDVAAARAHAQEAVVALRTALDTYGTVLPGDVRELLTTAHTDAATGSRLLGHTPALSPSNIAGPFQSAANAAYQAQQILGRLLGIDAINPFASVPHA